MRKKIVAIVTPFGAEPRTDNYAEFILAQTLQERGWKVRLHTYAIRTDPHYQVGATYQGVSVVRCRQRYGFSPALILSILRLRPSVVMCFHQKSFLNLSAYIGARLVGARFIGEMVGILHDKYIVNDVDEPEGNLKNPIRLAWSMGTLLRELLAGRVHGLWNNYVLHMPMHSADALIAQTDVEKTYIRQIFRREATRIYWCSPKTSTTTQTRPSVPLPEHYFFFIGQVKRRKGWDTAIEVLELLKKEEKIQHMVYVSPSKDMSVPMDYARAHGVFPQIVFLSSVTNAEKNWLLAHADFALVPSRYEGFGLPVVEAIMARKPIVCSGISVFQEMLKDGESALLCPVGDAAAMARAVSRLTSDPALAERLVAGGTEAAKQFEPGLMVDQYEMLFASLK